ncbi:hypothetical protein NB640_02810 [Oxalobacter vibrioformis]|uniref:Uncharacterized protein n=1 Tax=Oxalobacter vibrioformis TaxID=933080 RepID=A0A9E9M0I0_9BURK|nr:YmfL family putative regulatory protein [Oxalobacter vibrioformis]WAW10608.1 hypothetical protein NB640_02810 [Oxalobacter vibrioformis]
MNVNMAMTLQSLSETTYFAQAVAHESGGVFVKLPAAEEVGNDELLKKWNDLYTQLGAMSGTFNAATVDGEVDAKEKKQLQAHGHEVNRLVQELLALTFMVYGRQEKK